MGGRVFCVKIFQMLPKALALCGNVWYNRIVKNYAKWRIFIMAKRIYDGWYSFDGHGRDLLCFICHHGTAGDRTVRSVQSKRKGERQYKASP